MARRVDSWAGWAARTGWGIVGHHTSGLSHVYQQHYNGVPMQDDRLQGASTKQEAFEIINERTLGPMKPGAALRIRHRRSALMEQQSSLRSAHPPRLSEFLSSQRTGPTRSPAVTTGLACGALRPSLGGGLFRRSFARIAKIIGNGLPFPETPRGITPCILGRESRDDPSVDAQSYGTDFRKGLSGSNAVHVSILDESLRNDGSLNAMTTQVNAANTP